MQKDTAIVFDLDGTLANTAPDLLAALNHAVRDHGFDEFTINEIGPLVGHGAIAMLNRAFELHNAQLDASLLKTLHKQFLEYYEDNIAEKTRLFPAVEPLLEKLAKNGYRLAICTNKPEGMARKLLRELGALGFFGAITGGDTFAFRKPDERHLLETIKLAGAKNGLLIGDTITDANTAKNAGKPLILVDFGYSDDPIGEMGADRVIASFDEAFGAIEEILTL